MKKHYESILLNTIEGMATDADDRGDSSFAIRLSVHDAFEICRTMRKSQKSGSWIHGHGLNSRKTVCSNCGQRNLFSKNKRGYFLAEKSNYCPYCGAKMDL